jgi:type IV secretory pathway VirD2 relaxase
MDEDDFKPRLGRMRAKGGKRAKKYLNQVVGAVVRKRAVTGAPSRRFDGSRIGRGASIGRVLRGEDRHAGMRARRVVVKARLVKLAGKGLAGAQAHLRYIQRDGVTREGAPGQLYSARDDSADGKAFVERGRGDRHQFRFIVAAEDGDQYADLKPFVRRLMTQMEEDLGTKFDWVAVDHFNTGHPHTHIMLRGVDDRGQNLIIAREYIAHGMRERAAALVTLDLGPRTDLEIEERLRRDIREERLTAIDRRLVRDMDSDRVVSPSHRDSFQQSLRAGRLAKLGRLELAEDLGGGRWRLVDGIEDTLRRMGERGDIIRTMQRELTARSLDRPQTDHAIYDPRAEGARPMVGKLLVRGLSDEHADRHYLIVDGVDGRTHYVDIGKPEILDRVVNGAIVRIAPREASPREVDRTVARVAEANGGRYDVDAHLAHDPNASEAFAETHVRRLEAMRRTMGTVDRLPDGSWTIAPDHLARAAAFEARQARDRPVRVELLSARPLERLVLADAATWLDRELVSDDPVALRDNGFGREVRSAQALRRQWLIEQDLASERAGRTVYGRDMIALLQRRELLRIAGQMSAELKLPFAEAHSGERIEGVLRRHVDAVSGPLAVIENSREFTLVPWRSVLERQIGRPVAGIMRADGVSWTFGRSRSSPSIW